METWKPIAAFPNYEASDMGAIRRVHGRQGGCPKGKPLNHDNSRGYSSVRIRRDGRAWHTGVHRLVMMAFEPRPDCDSLQVNHLNGNKGDNTRGNLEWATASQNILHSLRFLGRKVVRGASHPMARLNEEKVKDIRARLLGGETRKTLSAEYGVSYFMIRDIQERKAWKHVIP